jgi:electron transfer flavoprotein alpha subunit
MATIWVVPMLKDGQLTRAGREAFTAAERLAAALRGGNGEDGEGETKAEAVVLGSGVEAAAAEAARRDFARVQVGDHPALATYTPGAFIGALAPAIRQARPDFVLFPHTYQAVDFVPRLAQEVGAALLPEVTGFAASAAEDAGGAGGAGAAGGRLVWTRPVMGGKMQSRVRVKGEGTVLVSVQAGAFPAAPAPAGPAGEEAGGASAGAAPIAPLALDAAALKPDREVLGQEEAGGNQVDLTKAEIIVAVGRGIGGADKLPVIEDLARALGAEIAASRPVIDNGWLPRDRQIGSSGQTVAPKLYIAAGISGAIQHLVGMKGSNVIVAINKDPSAPIFGVAHYGLVGDLHELLPALTEAVKAARG